MRSKHQNIGQWRPLLIQDREDYLLKISALLPADPHNIPYKLIPIEHYTDGEYGRVYRLEGAEQLNVESEKEAYFCLKKSNQGQCTYKKIIIIGFRPGEQRSFLIALVDISTQLDTP